MLLHVSSQKYDLFFLLTNIIFLKKIIIDNKKTSLFLQKLFLFNNIAVEAYD